MIPNNLVERMKILRIENEVNDIGRKKLLDSGLWTLSEIDEAFAAETVTSLVISLETPPQSSQLPPISPPFDIYQSVQPTTIEQLPPINNIPQPPVIEPKKKSILPLIIILLVILLISIGAYFYFTKNKSKSITSLVPNLTKEINYVPKEAIKTLTDVEGKPYQVFDGYTINKYRETTSRFEINSPDSLVFVEGLSVPMWTEPNDASIRRSTLIAYGAFGGGGYYQKINYNSLNDLPAAMTDVILKTIKPYIILPINQIKIDTTKLVDVNGRKMNRFTATVDMYDKKDTDKNIHGYTFIINNMQMFLIGLNIDQTSENNAKIFEIVEKMIHTGRVMK